MTGPAAGEKALGWLQAPSTEEGFAQADEILTRIEHSHSPRPSR